MTSDGLKDFLKRKGETPTGDKKKDIKLARKYLGKSYKEIRNESKDN